MIFNITSGGVAYISVSAPSGATITATKDGMSFSRQNTGNITVTSLGTWNVVCVYSGVTSSTKTATVSTYGSTSSNVSFDNDFTATIKVTTHPSASVSGVCGSYSASGTANSSGICNLTVPAGGLGTWTVTANNGATSANGTVAVSSYGGTSSISLLRNIPIISITSGGSTWTYKGASIDNSVVKIIPNGTGWKGWVRASCTVTFTYAPTNVSFWAIGKGGNGATAFSQQGGAYGGGGGGGGGQVVTQNNRYVSGAYWASVDSNGSSFGSIISAGNGESGGDGTGLYDHNQSSGGTSGGGSGNGSSGEWVNDHSYPATSGGGGSGGNGVYAFGDSTFDGVVYGHGGGGGAHSSQTPGYHSTTPGSGGGGAGHTGNYGRTDGNIGIICMRNAS